MTDSLTPAQIKGRTILAGSDQSFTVPSGQAVTLNEVIVDQPTPDNATYRFRFLAPAIARTGGTMTFETSIADMQYLCDSYAVQTLTAPLPASLQLIIAFSDMVFPFGDTNPEATQFFVAFSLQDGRCVMDPF